MSKYEPINCSHYDMLEIACMDQYEIELQLDDGCARGVAERLETRDQQEFLHLRKNTGHEDAIRVDRIRSMSVLSQPARFEFHDFTQVG
ncbi:MAG: Rho-binding antiterminator [Woeseiaceae bacterium]